MLPVIVFARTKRVESLVSSSALLEVIPSKQIIIDATIRTSIVQL